VAETHGQGTASLPFLGKRSELTPAPLARKSPRPEMPGALPLVRSRLAQPLDDGGIGHAAALTHRLKPIACAPLLERVDQGGHDARTAGSQRVADGDGAAVDVGLGQIGTDVLGPGICRI
jgi:hypothetical protein